MKIIVIIICVLLIVFLIVRRKSKKTSYSTGMKQCPSCGADNAPDADFCAECGSSMSLMNQSFDNSLNRCHVCGAALKPDSLFCANCGSKVKLAEPVPPSHSADFCPQCGARLKPGQYFCAECGASVRNERVDKHDAKAVKIDPHVYTPPRPVWDEEPNIGHAPSFSEEDYDMTVIMDDAVPSNATLEYFVNGISHRIRLNSDVTKIGSSKNGTDAALPSRKVSKIHAQIRCVNGSYYIRDLNSPVC